MALYAIGDTHLSLSSDKPMYVFGGGWTGYVEKLREGLSVLEPGDTVMGALARYISDESVTDFQPMGANFGILPPLDERIRSKQERYEKISQRGLESAGKYIEGENEK